MATKKVVCPPSALADKTIFTTGSPYVAAYLMAFGKLRFLDTVPSAKTNVLYRFDDPNGVGEQELKQYLNSEYRAFADAVKRTRLELHRALAAAKFERRRAAAAAAREVR